MEDENKTDNKKILVIVGVIALILVAVIAGLLIFRQITSDKTNDEASVTAIKTETKTIIAGELDINGVVPDGAIVVISATEVGAGIVTEFSTITTPRDQTIWSFEDAVVGKTYQIQVVMKSSDGIELAKSAKVLVTAPASNEIVTINLEGKDLKGSATISGVIKVNGQFPAGSTVNTAVKTPNTSFQLSRVGLPAAAATAVSYDIAVPGQRYDVIGYLYDASGVKIGESEILSVVAPASNEVLNINSTYTAIASEEEGEPAEVQGFIDLNGAATSNSRVVILQAPVGTTQFVVAVDNVPPVDGQSWLWTDAVDTTWYEMQAVLKERQQNGTDVDLAVSEIMTVAAPAINVTFKINTGIAPTPTP